MDLCSLLFSAYDFGCRKMFMCMCIQVGVSPRLAYVASTRCSDRASTVVTSPPRINSEFMPGDDVISGHMQGVEAT